MNLRGPAARAMAREPITPAQLHKVATVARGLGIGPVQWAALVEQLLGATASADAAAWSKAQASTVIGALLDVQEGRMRLQDVLVPVWQQGVLDLNGGGAE